MRTLVGTADNRPPRFEPLVSNHFECMSSRADRLHAEMAHAPRRGRPRQKVPQVRQMQDLPRAPAREADEGRQGAGRRLQGLDAIDACADDIAGLADS
jgi:hypothetical protein